MIAFYCFNTYVFKLKLLTKCKKYIYRDIKLIMEFSKQLQDSIYLIGHHEKNKVRRPGVEPGSTAWKATMLTVTPPTRLLS